MILILFTKHLINVELLLMYVSLSLLWRKKCVLKQTNRCCANPSAEHTTLTSREAKKEDLAILAARLNRLSAEAARKFKFEGSRTRRSSDR